MPETNPTDAHNLKINIVLTTSTLEWLQMFTLYVHQK